MWGDEQIVEWKNRPITVVDTETTGLDPARGHKLVEVSMVRIEDGEITKKFSTRLNPERDIPPEAVRIHGIRDQDVVNSPTFADVSDKLHTALKDGLVCAYNAPFDQNMLHHEFRAIWGQTITNSYSYLRSPNFWVDPKVWARSFYGTRQRNSLVAVCERLGVVNKKAHSALSDAVATAEVLIKLMDSLPDDFRTLVAQQCYYRTVHEDAYHRWQAKKVQKAPF